MHIFLTGAKRIGKSTLLNEILAAFTGQLGGFRTVRVNTYLPDQYTVHLIQPNGCQKATEENLLFVCGKSNADTALRFQLLGCRALKESADADLLVMDELGPHEAEASAFQNAVWSAVEGDVPILGVLQKADSDLLKKIAKHPKVLLLEVTEENRNDLAKQIPEWIKILRKR